MLSNDRCGLWRSPSSDLVNCRCGGVSHRGRSCDGYHDLPFGRSSRPFDEGPDTDRSDPYDEFLDRASRAGIIDIDDQGWFVHAIYLD
ncbi:hypothetical protein ACBJ59_36225 [Nonomuraea sp. MTCD27]|uniref:hypothetical protein n=1 Tax=Nonomuraea sp. MTCD27 TaxID=1676747 RepID=UPI0035C08076